MQTVPLGPDEILSIGSGKAVRISSTNRFFVGLIQNFSASGSRFLLGLVPVIELCHVGKDFPDDQYYILHAENDSVIKNSHRSIGQQRFTLNSPKKVLNDTIPSGLEVIEYITVLGKEGVVVISSRQGDIAKVKELASSC